MHFLDKEGGDERVSESEYKKPSSRFAGIRRNVTAEEAYMTGIVQPINRIAVEVLVRTRSWIGESDCGGRASYNFLLAANIILDQRVAE